MITDKNFVLDTSCAVKPALNEAGREKVMKIIMCKSKFRTSILVPDVFKYEFINTVSKVMGCEAARQAYDGFFERQVSAIPLEADTIKSALSIMDKYKGASFYDSCFHALAKQYNTFYLTADKRYYNLTRAEGDVKLLDDFKV